MNFKKLYKYDKKGVKEFLDYHTHRIEYENKGKSKDEVKQDIRRYTEKLLKRKKVIELYLGC